MAERGKECEGVAEVSMRARDHLTPTERRLLEILIANLGQFVRNEELLEAMSSGNRRSNIGDLRTSIWRLRKKMEMDPALPRVIITHRGRGYSFAGKENPRWFPGNEP